MKLRRAFLYVSSIAVCFLLAAGCEETAKTTEKAPTAKAKPAKGEKVNIALSMKAGDTATYKSVIESEDCVKYTGNLKSEPNLKDRCNKKTTEIVFTQQIESVDEQGNAIANITIKELKCKSVVKDETVLDADSTKEADKDKTIVKLVGQSYKIKIAPNGDVTDVIDADKARTVLQGNPADVKEGLKLMSPEIIKERHSIATLPEPNNNQIATDGTWSNIRAFDFGKLGTKPYERTNTLKEIKKQDGKKTAIISIEAMPTAKMAKQIHKDEGSMLFMKMFDNTYTYTGDMEFDTDSGKVIKCHEKLDSQWVAVDPDSADNTIMMTALRINNIEAVESK